MTQKLLSIDRRWSFPHLQIIGQFRSAGIARIHCDGDEAVWIQLQLRSLEREILLMSLNGSLDAQHLERSYMFILFNFHLISVS